MGSGDWQKVQERRREEEDGDARCVMVLESRPVFAEGRNLGASGRRKRQQPAQAVAEVKGEPPRVSEPKYAKYAEYANLTINKRLFPAGTPN